MGLGSLVSIEERKFAADDSTSCFVAAMPVLLHWTRGENDGCNRKRPRTIYVVGRSMPIKRTLTEPHKNDKRDTRRDDHGQFTEDQVDVGKLLAADRRTHPKTVAPRGQGDHGDQKQTKSSSKF
jgi:hypothetical protein